VDKVPDFIGYNNCFYCWLKGVRVAFLLKKGLLKSSSGYYKYLKVDIIAIAAIGIEVDFIDYCGGKQGSGSIFPAVVALIYIGV